MRLELTLGIDWLIVTRPSVLIPLQLHSVPTGVIRLCNHLVSGCHAS